MRYLALLALLSASAFAQTVTIPSQTIQVVIPAQTITLPVTPPVTPPVVPPVIPRVTGIPHLDYVVYQNGKAPPAGDDSWDLLSLNYTSTSNPYSGNTQSLQAVLENPNGGWQPLFVPNGATSFFDLSSYKYLLLSIRPTVNGNGYWIGFSGNLDTPDGIQIQIAGSGMTKYCPVPQASVWENCKIPLADFKMSQTKALFKFGVVLGPNPPATTQFDNVGLSKS